MTHIFLKRAPLFAAFCAAAAIAACKSDSSTGPSTPAAVAAETSPPTTATAGVTTTGPSVIVTDASGAPVAGVEVKFAVTAGGGAIQYPVATTGPGGVAAAGAWQIGAPGVNTVTATVEGLSPLSFSTTAQLGNGSQILKRTGDNQIGQRNTALPIPLTVQVVNAGGIGIPGQTVTFTTTTGGDAIAGSPAVTDANGFATSGTWSLGPVFGDHTVIAQSGSLQTTFTAIVDPCFDRTPLAVGGTATGTLAFDVSRCALAGFATDRYSLPTSTGAVNLTLTSTDFNAFLNVRNAAGTDLIASNNDASSATTNAAIKLITAATTKTVDATSAAAGETGNYTLSAASTSSDVADCSPVFIEIGATTDQTLTTTDCDTNYASVAGDQFLVYIPAGITIRISQTAVPLDALIAFLSPDGTLIVERDNGGVGASGTEIVNYTATTAGFYKIVATSYCLVYDDTYRANCDYGPYTLSVIKP